MISRHTRKKHTAAGILALLLAGAACDDSHMAPQELAAERLAFSPDAVYIVTRNIFWPGQRQPDPWLYTQHTHCVKFETVEVFDLFLRNEIEGNVNKEGYANKTIELADPSLHAMQAYTYTYFDLLHNVTTGRRSLTRCPGYIIAHSKEPPTSIANQERNRRLRPRW